MPEETTKKITEVWQEWIPVVATLVGIGGVVIGYKIPDARLEERQAAIEKAEAEFHQRVAESEANQRAEHSELAKQLSELQSQIAVLKDRAGRGK